MFHAFTFVFLRSRLFSAKGRRRLFCRHSHVLLRQWRENLPYVLYTEAAEETATVLILESIVRHFVSVSKSRFAIFNQYNVNNVKLNS